jgi:hypothetical protein
VLRYDEVELQVFARRVANTGVHLVCAAGPAAVAATALLGKALGRANVGVAGRTVIGPGERIGSPTWRAWLADAPPLLLVGLDVRHALRAGVAQLAVDAAPGEPLPAHALRLASALAPIGDMTWCAALGLIGRRVVHPLVERALAQHARSDLRAIAELLDAAARGPAPASETLIALEMLTASPDPRRFLRSVAAEALRHTQALVHAELVRAAGTRPRPGYGVLVVEYDSPCHVEDLVAARWRGVRPGTAVLVANHGVVADMVAVTARAAASESLERLRPMLGEEGSALLDRATWAELCQRLGVPPASSERAPDGAAASGALPN